MKKRNKIYIEKLMDKDIYTSVVSNEVYFFFVSSPANGRKQCNIEVSCKDYLHQMVQLTIFPELQNVLSYNNTIPIDLTKLRIVVSKRFNTVDEAKRAKKDIFSAKRVLNYYENIAGWNKSKITTAYFDKEQEDTDKLWLITGPKQWMSNPALLSMMTLLLRVGINLGGFPEEINEKTLKHRYLEMTNIKDIYNSDHNKINTCYKYFSTFMSKYKELFNIPMEEAYDKDYKCFHSMGGIVSLCSRDNCNEVLNNKISNLGI